jgi:hypothetical protein
VGEERAAIVAVAEAVAVRSRSLVKYMYIYIYKTCFQYVTIEYTRAPSLLSFDDSVYSMILELINSFRLYAEANRRNGDANRWKQSSHMGKDKIVFLSIWLYHVYAV